MNENLNLVEILKDCPKGTKLYSVVHGEVEFYQVSNNEYYPISIKFKSKSGEPCVNNVTADGRYCLNTNGECTLFPAKHIHH